jgi:DNA-binding NarL/FixJ family response regulator
MKLTARERQVAELHAQGLKSKQIAEKLGIATGTVKIHLKKIRMVKTAERGRFGTDACTEKT